MVARSLAGLLTLFLPFTAQAVPIGNSTIEARALGNGVPLRIIPLGASIVYGQASTDGNGFRAHLRASLTGPRGNLVNMVGSRKSGTMLDNDVEGWPGFRVDQVHVKATSPNGGPVARFKPNVILINAGTNDALQSHSLNDIGRRMESMLIDLWNRSPRAVILLSTLIINRKPEIERNVITINAQYRTLARRLRREGRHIVLVEMHCDPNAPTAHDMADTIHPNDSGYKKMADLWYRGMLEASGRGWLQPPETVEGLPDDGTA